MEESKKVTINYSFESAPTLYGFYNSYKRIIGVRGPYGCLPGNSEFLTPYGWKSMNSYTKEDRVAQWNPSNNCIEYVVPEEYIELPCDSFLNFNNCYSMSMSLSDEHRVVFYDWKGELREETALYISNKIKKTKEGPRFYVPVTFRSDKANPGIDLTDDQLRIMVAVIADGHFHKYYRNKGIPRCNISLRKDRKKERLITLLSNAGIEWKTRKYEDRPTETVYDFMAPLLTKEYDNRFWQCDQHQLEVIYNEFRYWDGTVNDDGEVRFFSTLKSSVDFIQYVCHATGHRASISEIESKNPKWSKCYIVQATRTMDERTTFRNSKVERVSSLDGKKYCFKVPSSYFIARHNGRIFITGNSGKSSACVWKLIKHGLEQAKHPMDGKRYTRFAIIRNTYPSLKDSTIRKVLEWLPNGMFGTYKIADHDYIIDAFPGCVIELNFRALDTPKHVRNLLSAEFTGAWINEAREIPKVILDALDARIGRYNIKDVPCTWKGILMDTNSPEEDSWWHQLFAVDKPDNAEEFIQPSARSAYAENTMFLPNDYYSEIIKGKDQEWLRVYIDNEYGFVKEGECVYETTYVDRLHYSQEILTPVPGRDIVIGLDFGLCYSDDTEVLTDTGWKFFKDVNEKEDKVATLNPDGFNLEYTLPNFKVEYDYDDELIEFKSQNFDFLVTPEHRVPFTNRGTENNLRFTSAEDLASNFINHRFIQLKANWNASGYSILGLSEEISSKFMGWFLSEGHVYNKKNYYRVCITQVKENPDLISLLNSEEWAGIGIEWKRRRNDYVACSRKLGEYLKVLGNKYEKYIPSDLKNNITCNGSRLFIETFVMGDGHKRFRGKIHSGIGRKETGESTAATVSIGLRDGLQEIALKAGYSSCYRFQKPQTSTMKDGRKIVNNGIYIITFKQFTRAEILPEHISRKKYCGKIYCLNVKYHTLYVRRNGRTCWNGNTPSAIFTQVTPRGHFNILEEYVSDSMGIKRFSNNILKPLISSKYRGYNIIFTGDTAGNVRSQNDERTCYQDIAEIFPGCLIQPTHTNSPVARIGAVEYFLTQLGDMGVPCLQLSNNCTELRKGFNKGYVKDKLGSPKKGKFSHPHDALQYAALYFQEHIRRDERMNRRPTKRRVYAPATYTGL